MFQEVGFNFTRLDQLQVVLASSLRRSKNAFLHQPQTQLSHHVYAQGVRDPSPWVLCELEESCRQYLFLCSAINASAPFSLRPFPSSLGPCWQLTSPPVKAWMRAHNKARIVLPPTILHSRRDPESIASSASLSCSPVPATGRNQIALTIDRHERLLNLAHPASEAGQHQPIPSLIPSIELVSSRLSSLAAVSHSKQRHNAHTGVHPIATAARSEPWGIHIAISAFCQYCLCCAQRLSSLAPTFTGIAIALSFRPFIRLEMP